MATLNYVLKGKDKSLQPLLDDDYFKFRPH